jgi:hypothetical protein
MSPRPARDAGRKAPRRARGASRFDLNDENDRY